MRFDVILGETLRRAACPHVADSPNFMCSNGKTLPHPARCATFSPGAKATIGFSPRRNCHEVTDEVKSHGLVLPAVCGHTAIQVGSRRNYRKIHIYKRQKTTALRSLRRSLLRAQIITCISHCFVR